MKQRRDTAILPDVMQVTDSTVCLRAVLLFADLFLIVTALYLLKPSSRSLILDVISAAQLPYVWLLSAGILFAAVAAYQWLLERFQRLPVVLAVTLAFVVVLPLMRQWLQQPGSTAPLVFYIVVDLLGVMLVEQFWSLANSLFSAADGKRWYGLIGAGGLLGGGAGSTLAATLVRHTTLETADLLWVAAAILGLVCLLTLVMGWLHLYDDTHQPSAGAGRTWQQRGGPRGRYLVLIAAALLMAQWISPWVEFQFMRVIEASYSEREARTAILGDFFTLMSLVSLIINLVMTPLILQRLGVLAGLLVQPLVLVVAAWGYGLSPGIHTAVLMKISDRGLTHSLTRASRELLYIPVDAELMYRAKGWIDMFGYRVFKMLGALSILFLTQWTSLERWLPLNHIIVLACLIWAGLLVVLHRDYRRVVFDISNAVS